MNELRVAYDLCMDHKNAKLRVDELKIAQDPSQCAPQTFSLPTSPLLVPNKEPIRMSASPMVSSAASPVNFNHYQGPRGIPNPSAFPCNPMS